MSVLFPFYALAGLAILAPLLFHLVRKKPKERIEFSSSIFLEPAPPRLTRHSQVDQWLLLLLRSAAILLVAFAFSRPYWDQSVASDSVKSGIRRLILVDTSASMRRPGVLERAKSLAARLIDESEPTDIVSVYSFAGDIRPEFSTSESLDTLPEQRRQLAQRAAAAIKPTWFETNLGLAMSKAVDLLQRDDDLETDSAASQVELVVISDFQQGSQIQELPTIHWPEGCQVRFVSALTADSPCHNATLRVLAASNDESLGDDLLKRFIDRSAKSRMRVRVSNSTGSTVESFQLTWLDSRGRPIPSTNTPALVPAGQARVILMPERPEQARAIHLTGDFVTFDNDLFVSPIESESYQVLCLDSSPPTEESSIGFFLSQVPLGSPGRDVQVRVMSQWTDSPIDPNQVPVVVMATPALADVPKVKAYVEAGGKLLWVWDKEATEQPDPREQFAEILFGSRLGTVKEARVDNYSMLEEIDFSHWLFRDLSDSKFSDFTRVRFWKHRGLTLSEPKLWRVLAKFDDSFPAVLHRSMGHGSVMILTFGWQPEQSQLALSSKFVPLISRFCDEALPVIANRESYMVGQKLSFRDPTKCQKPDGETIELASGEDIDLELPGFYLTIDANGRQREYAVNLASSESILQPLDRSQLIQAGVPLDEQPKLTETMQRQLRAVELEARQSPWRWLLVGVLMIIALESVLSAWRTPFKRAERI